MKHNIKLPCMILATALAAALHAAVPLAWEARPNAPAPASFDRHHGETIDFRCTLTGFDAAFAPAADVRLWYQTNGMGQAWWSAPATVQSNVITATWSPALDPGADRVSLFFGAPSNVYASAVLRLRHSPGFTPSVLTLPVQRLDFAAVEVANAPYYTKTETEAKIAELAPVPGDYETVSDRAMRISLPGDEGHPPSVYTPIFRGRADSASESYSLTKTGQAAAYGELKLKQRYQEDGEGLITIGWWPTFLDAWNAWHWVASEDYVDDAINNIDIPSPPDLTPYATKTELGGVSETANAAAFDASRAMRIVLGESVWFAVTNHMRTAKGVIPSLQLWEVRDSVTNLVYDSREEITNTVKALTRELHTELTNSIHAVEKTIPSKAWGNYQSDGTDNPEPGKVAIINQPTVILAGGGTFNKYVEIGDSSIWVLTSSGPVSFGGGGTSGNYFAILDDEGNATFKVSKTDSFDVGAIFTDNPRTSGDALLLYVCSTNRQGEAYIGPPTLSACTNLQAAVWHDEADGEIDALGTSVAWAHNDAIHAWVGTVTQDRWATATFFRAKMKQEGCTVIINTTPVRFDGGIQLGNGTYRLVPYTTGGKTYLTVEDLQ